MRSRPETGALAPQDVRVRRAFLAAPNAQDSGAIVDGIVVPVLQRLQVDVVRVPKLPTHLAAPAILDHVAGCDLAIGVLIDRNPNVFWELGVAYALGKPLVLLAREEVDFGLLANAGQCVLQGAEATGTRVHFGLAVRRAIGNLDRRGCFSSRLQDGAAPP